MKPAGHYATVREPVTRVCAKTQARPRDRFRSTEATARIQERAAPLSEKARWELRALGCLK